MDSRKMRVQKEGEEINLKVPVWKHTGTHKNIGKTYVPHYFFEFFDDIVGIVD